MATPATTPAHPKPHRLRSQDSLRTYSATHPVCELSRCEIFAVPHHIRNQSLGGGDEHSNLIALCWRHHMGRVGIHPLGPKKWLERYGDQLSDTARAKFAARKAAA